MQIEVLQYYPHVECFQTPSAAALNACTHLLMEVPASEYVLGFGNEEGPGVDVKLPTVYVDGKRDSTNILDLRVLWNDR